MGLTGNVLPAQWRCFMNIINNFEKYIQVLYGIYVPIIPVKGILNPRTRAGYSQDRYCIYLNLDYNFKSTKDVISTLVHEGRHAWQHANGYMEIYPTISPQDDPEGYYNSVLERDARLAQENWEKGNLDALILDGPILSLDEMKAI